MGGPCDRRAQTVRRYAAVLLLVAVACVATPGTGIAQASPKAIRFAPPLDRTLAYRVVQYVGTGKTQRRFESVRHLRFAPDGGGYRLTVTLRDVTGEGPPPAVARYRAALAPLIGVTQHMRIDRNGRIIAIDNMPDVWAAFMQGQQALLALLGQDAATRAAIDYIGGLDERERVAVLAGDVQPLMLFASGTPLPTMRVEDDSDAANILFKEEDQDNGIVAHYTVMRATGLVYAAQRLIDRPPQKVRETRLLSGVAE